MVSYEGYVWGIAVFYNDCNILRGIAVNTSPHENASEAVGLSLAPFTGKNISANL